MTIEVRRSLNGSLAAVKGILWDLDNTLYRVDELIEDAFNIAFARVAIKSGVPLEFSAAVDLARRSFLDHGSSGHVFIRDYGITREDLHDGYHSLMDEAVIEKSHEVCAFFKTLDLGHVLITHSHREWARRVLAHIELLEWFDDSRILGLEDYNFRHKHECRSSFESGLERLGIGAGEAVMVEDTLKNLKIPHEMGMITAYIHHGRKPDILPDFVDISCNSTLDLLGLLERSRAEAPAL